MHSLSVIFGPTGTNWRFLFKSVESAKRATENVASALRSRSIALHTATELVIDVHDDFGQSGQFHSAVLHGFMLEDLDQTKLAASEMMVHNARAQADAEAAMRADPKIMASARNRQGGPPILAPMGNGFTR